jgi:hypothetical protein
MCYYHSTWSQSISYYSVCKSESLHLVWYVTFHMLCINLWMSITHFVWYVTNYNLYYMLRICKTYVLQERTKSVEVRGYTSLLSWFPWDGVCIWVRTGSDRSLLNPFPPSRELCVCLRVSVRGALRAASPCPPVHPLSIRHTHKHTHTRGSLRVHRVVNNESVRSGLGCLL